MTRQCFSLQVADLSCRGMVSVLGKARNRRPDHVRVLILTRYDHMGSSSRVRFLQYIPHLERAGLQCEVQYLFSNATLERLYAGGRRSRSELAGGLPRR